MRCVFTEQAESDLEAIGDGIALDNPLRATTFIEELKQTCKNIVNVPQGYPLASEYGKHIRKLPYGNYLILYTLTENEVIILHIKHGAQLPRTILTSILPTDK